MLFPVLLTAVILTACNSNDYGDKNAPGADGAGVLPADSAAMMHTDSMLPDHTHVAPMDSTDNRMLAKPDSMAKIGMRDTAMKMKTGTKKGKVTIVPAPAAAKTAAMEMDKEGFYASTEVLPAYPGGDKALERFFEKNIVYPDDATENNAEGTVNLTFAVDENGKVYNPMVTSNKIGYGLEDEAIRVFKKMPTWTPGRIKGKNVKTRYTLPIRFQLY